LFESTGELLVLSPKFNIVSSFSNLSLAKEAEQGLMAENPSLPPKFFYDKLGSRLFDAITALPQYTPPHSEAAIIEAAMEKIVKAVGCDRILVDLGAGNCEKATKLFDPLMPLAYVAVDIAKDHLYTSLNALQKQYPLLPMHGVVQDFSQQLILPKDIAVSPRVFFYPGSSIGNFTPTKARNFLAQIHKQLCGGALILGVDLVKPIEILELAYNDPLQVTAAFNLNILQHVNHVLGADFHVTDFEHHAFFNRAEQRIEMHLRSKKRVVVTWAHQSRVFEAGQTIHTENSYKYTPAQIKALLQQAGFARVAIFTDPQDYFAVACAS